MCIIGILTNLKPHPELPNLIIANINQNQVIVGNHYDENTLGVFIPTNTILPDHIAKELWVYNKLAGKKRNKVIEKIRNGVLSQGLFYGKIYFLLENDVKVYYNSLCWNPNWIEHQDVTNEFLGL